MTRLKHWLYRSLFDVGGPVMLRFRGHWRYIDPYGNIWLVEPTFEHSCPLRITLEVRG